MDHAEGDGNFAAIPQGRLWGQKVWPWLFEHGCAEARTGGSERLDKGAPGIASEHETIERKGQEYPATFGYACLIAELQRKATSGAAAGRALCRATSCLTCVHL